MLEGQSESYPLTQGLHHSQMRQQHPFRAMHPQQHANPPNSLADNFPCESELIKVTEDEVLKAVNCFPTGSAGGPDGLRPVHIRDLIARSAGDAGTRLLTSITQLTNLVLSGGVCPLACSSFFGATLVALEKKDGGIRPIAGGNTLRRIAGKSISHNIQDEMGNYLRPVQLGYGTRGGCEAAIHSLRQFAEKPHASPKVILKGDFANAWSKS